LSLINHRLTAQQATDDRVARYTMRLLLDYHRQTFTGLPAIQLLAVGKCV